MTDKKRTTPRPIGDLLDGMTDDPVVAARIAKIRSKAGNRPAPPPEPAPVVQLPLWPDPIRSVPNGVLRSALFGAVKKGARASLIRQEIHAQEGIHILYTGARLDQGDLDVWETVLHIARLQELGDECRITAYQFLKLLGKTDTGKNRKTLNIRLSRMNATALDVTVAEQPSYEGSLIDGVYRAEGSREYIICLNPQLQVLFAPDQFTQIEWSVRQALSGKPLAQWLHGYYSSHAQPFPLKIETLYMLCGSEAATVWKYAQTLRKALAAVAETSAAYGENFSSKIVGDLVYVDRTPSKTQRRHLAKKARRPKKRKI